MGQRASRGVAVQGTVAPGYETVRDIFQENFDKGREESAQLCVYVGEQQVVDLWGSADPSYTPNTLTNVFSSTKSLTAIAMAAMFEEGLLSYDSRIADYWPEFAQKGKGETTVADLMRHEGGLAHLDRSVALEDCLTENIKKNSLGQLIEEQEQQWPEEGRRLYHAITRGWVANEVFRRVHPEGNTIGEFLRTRVSGPLEARVYVGVEGKEVEDYAPVGEIKMSFLFGQSLLPNGGVDINFIELCKVFKMFVDLTKNSAHPPDFVGWDMAKDGFSPIFNQDLVRRGETSSANGNCSARGLAKVAAAMANGGSLGGVKVLGKKGWDALHAEPTAGTLGFTPDPMYFTQGGVAEFRDEQPGHGPGRAGYFGWLGYGGSVFQWRPSHKIGFAYTPTVLEFHCLYNRKGARLQGEVVRCAEELAAKTSK